MKVKAFKGRIDDGAQTTIRLSTNNGLTGYKIKKLQLMGVEPQGNNQESVVKVFSVKQTTVTNTFDFSVEVNCTSGLYKPR